MNPVKSLASGRSRSSMRSGWMWSFPALALSAALLLMSHAGWFSNAAYAQNAGGGGRGGRGGANAGPNAIPLMPMDRELAMKIKPPFTLVAVGDLINRVPTSGIPDQGFQNLVKTMNAADVTFANQEGPIIDQDSFDGPIGGATGAPVTALADMKAMNIKIVGTANNHSMDAGPKGVLETIRLLDSIGVTHGGTGRNLQEARAARFLNTPKGSVGVVAMWSNVTPDGATYSQGDRAGSPGFNPLHLTEVNEVTPEQMANLKQIRDTVYARRSEVFAPIAPADPNEPKDSVELFNQRFRVGKVGDVDYDMNPNDLREILKSIRNGKESSDFMIAEIHCHEGNYAFQTYTYDNDTPPFLVDFAHKTIDNGADEFVGTGVHTIRGVEIYKGKPIFYGLDTFIYEYASSLPQNPGGNLTDAEATMSPGSFAGERVTQAERLESLMVQSHWEGGKLTEVRIYPVDLGQEGGRSFARLGVPMTPSPAMAQRVLEKVQRLSAVWGTKISIENGVGVIHITEDQGKSSVGTTTAER